VLLKIARAMVEKGGHTVVDAPNGRVAVEKAKAEKPDLIVLDAEMPEMSGLEALQALKADPTTQTIPVYIYTGHDLGGPEEAGFKSAGAVQCFTKPYKPDVLLGLIPG
jgi:CheY-like chemotaxis protein